MTALLTTHRLVLLRAALVEYLGERERRQQLLRDYLQGVPFARAAVLLGDEINEARGMLDDVEDLLAQATGQPRIQKGNADLASESATHPLTREQEAQEANLRG